MDRLTYRDESGAACFRWEKPGGNIVIANAAISRLATYEDTGLSPEGIGELHERVRGFRSSNKTLVKREAEIEKILGCIDVNKHWTDPVDKAMEIVTENAQLKAQVGALHEEFIAYSLAIDVLKGINWCPKNTAFMTTDEWCISCEEDPRTCIWCHFDKQVKNQRPALAPAEKEDTDTR